MGDNANVTLMKAALRTTEASLLARGVPQPCIIYVVRNGGTEWGATLGAFFANHEDAHVAIERCNAFQPEDGTTTFECMAVDAREHKQLKELLKEGLADGFWNDADFKEYMHKNGWDEQELPALCDLHIKEIN